MKPNDSAGKDEALSKLLGTWKSDAQLPPRFAEAVWRRIESAEPHATRPMWQALFVRIESAFRRPAFAAAYIAALLFIGLGAGYWRAEDRTTQEHTDLRSRYVQSVNPYQMPR